MTASDKKPRPTSAQRRLEAIKPVYLREREDVFLLALALLQNTERAFDALETVFLGAAKRKRHALTRKALLCDTLRVCRRMRRAHAQPPGGRLGGEAGALQAVFGLEPAMRCAFVLTRLLALPEQEAAAMLRMPPETLRETLRRADALLCDLRELPAAARAACARLMQEKEIWNTLCFRAERSMRLGRRVRNAALFAALAAALCLLARESVLLTRLLGARVETGVVTARVDSEDYWRKKTVIGTSAALPGDLSALSQSLPPGAAVRVDFTFYDAQVMAAVREGEDDLLSLYTALYETGERAGRLHRLICRGITEYYKTYERPLRPEARLADFHSAYASIYDATLAFAAQEGAQADARAVDEHPEIFASREAFEAYLYGDSFQAACAPLRPLLLTEKYLAAHARGEGDLTAEEAAAMRAQYEEYLYNFDYTYGRAYTPAPLYLTQAQVNAFTPRRAAMGERLAQALCEQAAREVGAPVTPLAPLAAADSSAFSATVSRETLLDMLADGRFRCYGLSVPQAPAAYPGNLSPLLAARVYEGGLLKRYAVYRVDDTFVAFNTNYAAPLRLPEGFIAQLRAAVPCENTRLETQLGYDYALRYAHAETLNGYVLLRRAMNAPGTGYADAAFAAYAPLDISY